MTCGDMIVQVVGTSKQIFRSRGYRIKPILGVGGKWQGVGVQAGGRERGRWQD